MPNTIDQLRDPRLHRVIDPTDAPNHAQLLASLHNPELGRFVCEMRPDNRGNLAWLSGTLLQSFGKDTNRRGQGRDAQTAWRRTIAWAASLNIDQLFITRSHFLKPNDLKHLIDLAALIGCETWFIQQAETLPRERNDAVRSIPFKEWSFPQFTRHWSKEAPKPATARAKTKRATKQRYNELPDDEFFTFRASCEAFLTKTQFTAVEKDALAAFEATDQWLDNRSSIENEDASEMLHDLLTARSTRSEMLVTLRAAQEAFFLKGYMLQADLDRLLSHRRYRLGQELLPDIGSAVESYACTVHAAAGAMCFALDDPQLTKCAALSIADVSFDGSTVEVSDRSFSIPVVLRPAIAAHRRLRQLDGAVPTDPFFLAETNKLKSEGARWQRATSRAIKNAARDVSRETGIPLIVRYQVSQASAEGNWAFQLGINVTKLREVIR